MPSLYSYYKIEWDQTHIRAFYCMVPTDFHIQRSTIGIQKQFEKNFNLSLHLLKNTKEIQLRT